ncbi:MAG: hypothetical protein QG636_745 [Patescibacteria group bacterium]|jgi:hypothetical protein|nr:hypothetical protein [Patescibacteria group bacterium]
MKKFILDGNKIKSLEDFGIQLSGLASDSETEERTSISLQSKITKITLT